MAEAKQQRIFVSYARQDGMELALRLKKDLANAGFDVWLDTQRIKGGASWTTEIERAIDKAEVVLALLTAGSYVSEICRAEQLRSLRKGKCVIPLLAAPGTDTPLHLETKNYRNFAHEGVYTKSFRSLLDDIQGRKGVALAERYQTTPTNYITAPPKVANYLDRPEAVRALRDTLFRADGHRAIAVTALEGMGGVGKTVLAQALFKDAVVREAFPDGLVWITVGRDPTHDIAARLREITAVLGGASDERVTPETLFRTTIAERAALIVLDDIWSKADLDPFLAESPRSRYLFTTRDSSIARFSDAREYTVDPLDAPQARELLTRWVGLAPAQLPPVADDILRECGRLPLALSTVGALLRGAAPAEWTDTARLLHNADLAVIEEQLPSGQQSFFRAIDVSVKALSPQMQERYGRLAVLLDDMSAALPVLQTLWRVGEGEARRIGRQLADRSLAHRDHNGGLSLHDLQLDYVRARYANRETLEWIHGAVRLSAHVIEKDAWQFASQIVGRLLPLSDVPAIHQFLDEIVAGASVPWLRPIHPGLHPVATELVRTLQGHSDAVRGVALTAGGKRAISASADETLKVWDVETGLVLRTLEGHSLSVSGVAVTADGERAISASRDRTLKVWDLGTGRILRTLKGHSHYVYAISVTADGKRAVSASEDKTLKVWDLGKGREVHTLWGSFSEGHRWSVYGVTVTVDGKRAVSASFDRTLKVWDLKTGHVLRTLEGHSDAVRGVAVTADGMRAVSASEDKTLKVWDLETGRVLRTLEGHTGSVNGVAVTVDGKRAVSASQDRTLKLWDLEAGHALRTLEGHSDAVSGVALTADGRRAVSASEDKTLKVWELESGRMMPMLEGHSSYVYGVSVTADGMWAVSASLDNTLKVWDMKTGRVLRNLEGHSGSVEGVAVTAHGEWALSASTDRTLKVWDLKTGSILRTLKGHSDSVKGVAVTADGKRAVSASTDRTLRVWDLKTGRILRTLEGHSSYVHGVAVTADGMRAVSASWDNTLKVWDLKTGRILRTLEGHSSYVHGVAVTADGRRAVSASEDKTLKVWDLGTGRMQRTLEGHSDAIRGVAVTADGKRAVSASPDNTVRLWELETGSIIATFHCDGAAYCCALSDEQNIVAGDSGGRLYILSIESHPPKVSGIR
jgi:WD40 repeat protein